MRPTWDISPWQFYLADTPSLTNNPIPNLSPDPDHNPNHNRKLMFWASFYGQLVVAHLRLVYNRSTSCMAMLINSLSVDAKLRCVDNRHLADITGHRENGSAGSN